MRRAVCFSIALGLLAVCLWSIKSTPLGVGFRIPSVFAQAIYQQKCSSPFFPIVGPTWQVSNLNNDQLLQWGCVDEFGNLKIADLIYVGMPEFQTDACLSLNRALLELPATGGIVNAISHHGTLSCTSNPFSGFSSSGQLILGNVTYQITTPWILPEKFQVIGSGRGDKNSTNTVIEAVTGFPASTPLIQFGVSGALDGTKIQNLGIDCNNQTGAIGIQVLFAQEQSQIAHVMVRDCPGIGIDIETSAAQNFGPLEDFELLNTSSCSNCNASTINLIVKNTGIFRGAINGTINNAGVGIAPNVLAKIDTSGAYFSNINLENSVTADGFLLASQATTAGITFNNITCFTLLNCIHLSNLQTDGPIVLFSISSTGSVTNLIKDDTTGQTITQASQPTGKLGFYLVGDGTLGSNAQIITDAIANTVGLRPGSSTFATLGTPSNGVIKFCTDCNATCAAGAGTGRMCVRENGAWVGF